MIRYEYVVVGDPMRQISIAEPAASGGESCASPEAWSLVLETVEGDPSRKAAGGFMMLRGLDTTKHTFPTVRYGTEKALKRLREEHAMDMDDTDPGLHLARRFIPKTVFQHMRHGTSQMINEIRSITVAFVNVVGFEIYDEPDIADDLMVVLQEIVHSHEGKVNKFVFDDKGCLFVLVWGLPPFVHTDDPIRAVLACHDLNDAFQLLNLTGRFGIATGRAYCGVVGSQKRREYTVMGDTVNISAR